MLRTAGNHRAAGLVDHWDPPAFALPNPPSNASAIGKLSVEFLRDREMLEDTRSEKPFLQRARWIVSGIRMHKRSSTTV